MEFPRRGDLLQFLDLDTGRVLVNERPRGRSHLYRVHDHQTALTAFGSSRVAYFEPGALAGGPALAAVVR